MLSFGTRQWTGGGDFRSLEVWPCRLRVKSWRVMLVGGLVLAAEFQLLCHT